MISVFEEFDVLLQVLQVQLLLRFVEQSLVGFITFEARCLLFQLEDRCLAVLHARVELGQLARMRVDSALLSDRGIFKLLAVVCESFSMVHDVLVTVVNFTNEQITLRLISLLQLAQFFHHVLSVRLQILENLGLDLVFLVNFLHSTLHSLILVIDLVFEDLAFSLQISKLQVDLLEDVKLAVSLENGLFQVLDFIIGLLLILLELVDLVLLIDESVYNRVNELLNKMPCL